MDKKSFDPKIFEGLKKLPKQPLVSVIIPAHNEEDYLWKALESLLKQTYSTIEIIVVDNASTDSTEEVIKKYADRGVILVNNSENGGFGGGCNLGWKHSKGELLMFFDADQIYGKDYIKDMIAPILENKDVCTMHEVEKIANIDSLWARAFGKRYEERGIRGEIYTIIRRDVFEKLGPYDPKYGYGDDKTLFYKHGLTSFKVDTAIWHHNPASLKEHWGHGKWVGKSYAHPWVTLLAFPLFPVYVAYKSMNQFANDSYWQFLFFLPLYHTVKYFSYFAGAIQKIRGKQ